MKPLISIIIPVYNAETFLKRCLESIINQTYKNLEIVIIDDGSVDSSAEICDEYSCKDSRIIVIHQDNSGVSTARNRALEKIKGEYVAFVDSDDYVTSDFIESLYSGIAENHVDLSICGLEKIGGIDIGTGKYTDDFENEKILLPNSGIVSREDLWFHSIDSNLIGCYLCNKLFKISLLHDIRLRPELSIGEDMVFIVQYLQRIDKAYYIAKPLYKYQMNEMSAMNSQKNEENSGAIQKKISSNMLASKYVQEYTKNEDENIQNMVSYRRIRTSVWCMFKLISSNTYDKDVMCEIKQTIIDNYDGYKAVGLGSKLQNTAVFIMSKSPILVYRLGCLSMKICPKLVYAYSRR